MNKSITKPKKINGEILTIDRLQKDIDAEIERLFDTGDYRRMDSVLSAIDQIENFSKFTQCKILYHYKKWWDAEEKNEVEFYSKNDYLASKVIIDRYISVWDKHENNIFPEEIKERSLDDQIKIAKALDAGYEIDDETWEELVTTTNVHKVIQEDVKGKKPTKNSYIPRIDEKGHLFVSHMGMEFRLGIINLPDDVDIKELSKELDDPDIAPKRKKYIIQQRALTKMLARIKSGLYLN